MGTPKCRVFTARLTLPKYAPLVKWSLVFPLLSLTACLNVPQKVVENAAPTVTSFSSSPSAGRNVTFAWGLSDGNGDALRCDLDANSDGTQEFTGLDCSATSSQAYTYPASGVFTAKLTVSDGKGGSVSSSTQVTIGPAPVSPPPGPTPPAPNPTPVPPTPVPPTPPPPPASPPAPPPVTPPPPANRPPVIASLTSSANGLTGAVSWSASDPDGNPLTCNLNWGDSKSETVTCSINTKTHAYSSAGSFTVTLTVADNAGGSANRSVTVTPVTPPTSSNGYTVTVLFEPSVADKYKPVFQQAAARWQSIITGDLPDISNVDTSSICAPEVSIPGSVAVDDVVILVGTFTEAPSGLLGYAGPCRTRASNGLTAVGLMKFDTADLDGLLNAGLLNATITHEMGHVLGIGTLWGNKGLTSGTSSNPNACGTNPRYIGARGVAEYKALGGTDTSVPLEDQFGPGSCEGHWRESVFKKELMTSYLNGGTNPLSRLSIASLEDLGYAVSYNSAETFSLTASVGAQPQGFPAVPHSLPVFPTGVIDDTK